MTLAEMKNNRAHCAFALQRGWFETSTAFWKSFKESGLSLEDWFEGVYYVFEDVTLEEMGLL